MVLDPNNPSVYKQLGRAAKAKLKLRLKVTVKDKEPVTPKPATVEDEEPAPVSPVADEEATTSTSIIEEPASETSTLAPSTTTYTEKPFYPGSVADIQRGFEELLINPSRSSFIAPPSCPAFNHNMPNSFYAHREVPRMNDCSSTEIPVTRGTTARDKWFAELAHLSNERQCARNNASPTVSVFTVFCNKCSAKVSEEHYHCSTCDDGDFDLCQSCVDDGALCNGEDHWMIKRFVKNGSVINSTTETIAPKAKQVPKAAISDDLEVPVGTRTCNSCIQELTEEHFVTCTTCPDFDLCLSCHVGMEHGHHPKHAFEPAVEDANLDTVAKTLLAPGRNVGHHAICDGCDKVSS